MTHAVDVATCRRAQPHTAFTPRSCACTMLLPMQPAATSRQARSPPQRWFLLDGDAAEESWLQLPAVRLDEVHLQLLQH